MMNMPHLVQIGLPSWRVAYIALLVTGLSACNNGDSGLLGGEPDTPSTANTAPQALDVAVWGSIAAARAGTTQTWLQLTGRYFDNDADVADTHEFRWLKNGSVVPGANSARLVLTSESELVDAEYVGCVTPIAKTGVRRGEEVCAPASTDGSPSVPPGTPVPGAKPTITGDSTVGGTLHSSYTYAPNGAASGSEEGNSLFGWLVYRDPSLPTLQSCTATQNTPCDYTVMAADEGHTIYSCVQPRNQLGVWGAVRCDTAAANHNFAPEVRNTAIFGVPTTGAELTLTGTYFDTEGDEADYPRFVFTWKVNDVVVSGATAQSMRLGTVQTGDLVTACVKPYAKTGTLEGQEVCTTTHAIETNPIGPEVPVRPVATPTISGVPLVKPGASISASYTYSAADNAAEGASRFAWLVTPLRGMKEVVWCPDATTGPAGSAQAGQACQLPLDNALRYVGARIQACVVPVNVNNVVGMPACTEVTGIGLTIKGKLVYGETLTGLVEGISGTATWRVDTSNKDGFYNDINPTPVIEQLPEEVESGAAVTYTIGLTGYMLSQGMQDINGNGVLDDIDWQAAENDAIRPNISAPNYIGKDVHFCVTTSEYGDVCAVASSFTHMPMAVDDICIDSEQCVSDGYYQSNAETLPLPARHDIPIDVSNLALTGKVGIAPVGFVAYSDGNTGNEFIYRRPQTAAEWFIENRKTPGLIPNYYPGVDSDGTLVHNSMFGEVQITYPMGIQTTVDYCHSLNSIYGGNWYVPVLGIPDIPEPSGTAGPGSLLNDLALFGNDAPTTADAALISLWQKVWIPPAASGVRASPVWGWPTYRYATASKGTEPSIYERYLTFYPGDTNGDLLLNDYAAGRIDMLNSGILCGQHLSP